MHILAVALGVLAALDGELGATVQAAKTHGALVLYPHWALVLYLNSMYGALLGAKTATYATVLQRKVARVLGA